MAKKAATYDDSDLAMEDAYVPGQWYMLFVPGGFTVVGRYVKSLGLGFHRFAHARHLRNAGDLELPQMCKTGPGGSTVWTTSSWRYLDCTPFAKAAWDGPIPAAWGG